LHPSAAAVLADYRQGRRSLVVRLAVGGPGLYGEVVEALQQQVDLLTRTGQIAPALMLRGPLGRLHLVLGDLRAAGVVQAEGEQLLSRVEPDSNAAMQFGAVRVFRSWLVEDDPTDTLDFFDRVIGGAARVDLRWLRGSSRLGRAFCLVALGHHDTGLAELAGNVAVIERAPIGELNDLISIHFAVQASWIANRADHVATLERNLRTKVLEPDFSYPESDGRWDAAVLCAMTGRPEEARAWFQRAHERLSSQGAILLRPYVCFDEALMEARLLHAGDRANGLRRLDEARGLVELIGLANLLPRVDDLTVKLTR
jgi:hypothetical protein